MRRSQHSPYDLRVTVTIHLKSRRVEMLAPVSAGIIRGRGEWEGGEGRPRGWRIRPDACCRDVCACLASASEKPRRAQEWHVCAALGCRIDLSIRGLAIAEFGAMIVTPEAPKESLRG